MSAEYPGPLFIDPSSVTRQVKRAHPLIDRNAIYPMIPPRGIGDGAVSPLARVVLRTLSCENQGIFSQIGTDTPITEKYVAYFQPRTRLS